jgi:MFS family permease
MGPRLLRAIANTVAVLAVLAALIGTGLALALSAYTLYEAEPWHYILIGAVALGLVVIAVIIHVSSRIYEKKRIIRDCWNAVKDADALDPEDEPAIDPDVISQRTLDELAAEVVHELDEDEELVKRRETKKKVKLALGAVAVAVPVILTGALIAMQKKLDVYKGKNTQKTPVVKGEEKK